MVSARQAVGRTEGAPTEDGGVGTGRVGRRGLPLVTSPRGATGDGADAEDQEAPGRSPARAVAPQAGASPPRRPWAGLALPSAPSSASRRGFLGPHKCHVSFLTGCHSCQWKSREWEKTELGSCCCSRREQFFYLLLVIACVLSVGLLLLWIEPSNEYFSFDCSQRVLSCSSAPPATASACAAWILGFLLLWERIELHLHSCHKVLIVLMILLPCIPLFMVVLFTFWKDRWLMVGLSLQIFSPYMHLSSVALMVIISWPLTFYVAHSEEKLTTGLPFLLILMPLGSYSSCIQEDDDLGPKPRIIGHRGPPMLGPENTTMSFEKAVEHGAHGLETDIYLSYDQVPFIMHDFDLTRTTNIKEVMPDAAYDCSAFFNWSFLSTLNAGKWFVQPEV
ncbi:LOW QUALITY PROTEIN: glycerophosphodiester phosphodiesterase domain-containing protein 4 [Ctenodactylus gundi]